MTHEIVESAKLFCHYDMSSSLSREGLSSAMPLGIALLASHVVYVDGNLKGTNFFGGFSKYLVCVTRFAERGRVCRFMHSCV